MDDTGKARGALVIGGLVLVALVIAGIVWGLPSLLAGQPASPSAPPTSAPTSIPTEPSVEPSLPPSESPAPTTPPIEGPDLPSGSANIVVTSAAWDSSNQRIELTGYIAGVIQDGGTCTLTAVGPVVRQVSREGIANVNDTSCGELAIPASDLPPGSYKVTLSYQSSSTAGTSGATEVTVP